MSHDKEFYGTFIAVMAGLAILAVLLVYTAISLTSDVSEHKPSEIVVNNIKPVGEVFVAGESAPEQAVSAAPAAAEPAVAKTGEQIYNSNCLACHTSGAAGAPKIGDVAVWAPRIAAGMDTVYTNAIKGLNAMPPKGLCMACSDDEIRATVDYIIEKSR